MANNFYDTLGVKKDASDDEIKKAYRKLAHKHHPDKAGGDEKKFKEINEAYQVLSDKTKRSQYDQFGQTFNQQGGAGGGGFSGYDFSGFGQGAQGFDFQFGGGDFEDIFSNIFGGSGGGQRGGRRAAKRGQDIQVDIEISFMEMVNGVEREVNLRKSVTCSRCHGTGGEPGTSKKTCPTCQGKGQVERVMKSFFGNFSQVTVCPDCDGAGETFEKKCSECGGDGRVKSQEKIKIPIPSGVNDGDVLTMREAGEAGPKGATPGDLYIVVHVVLDKNFSRQGMDIVSSEHINFTLATLGGETEIKTVDGSLILKIPSGTQSGEVFRVKNKGIHDLRRGGRGNQLVKIIVDVPKKLDRSQKNILEELKKLGL